MSSLTRTAGAAALLIAASISLAGCSTIGSIVDAADPIIDAVNEESAWLAVGDCFNEVGGDVVSDIPTVPCTEPHDYEVYAEFNIDRASFPGDDELFRLADEGCYAPFTTFVGLPFEESVLDYNYYVPTEGGWNDQDDRAVTCIIFDPAGEVTGTLAAAGR